MESSLFTDNLGLSWTALMVCVSGVGSAWIRVASADMQHAAMNPVTWDRRRA